MLSLINECFKKTYFCYQSVIIIKMQHDNIQRFKPMTSQNQMYTALARMKRMEQETEQEFIGLQTGIPGEIIFQLLLWIKSAVCFTDHQDREMIIFKLILTTFTMGVIF